MKKTFLLFAAALMSAMTLAQQETLMTINGKPVSAEEFLYIYQKNNQAGAIDPTTMDEYLDMFINFKLKVTEAEFLLCQKMHRTLKKHRNAAQLPLLL